MNRVSLINFIKYEHRPLILDGGLATELETAGFNLNDPLWSAKLIFENPEAIENVHFNYLCAGADIVTTSSYQANINGFLKKGFSNKQSEDLIRESAFIAKRAIDRYFETHEKRPVFIAGSLGSFGASLADGSEYTGAFNATKQDLYEYHRVKFDILAETGIVDIMAFETIPSVLEAQSILQLCEDRGTVPSWISFSLKDTYNISDGSSIKGLSQKLKLPNSVISIGINCCNPNWVVPALTLFKNEFHHSLVAYPNSGEEYNSELKKWIGTKSNSTFDSINSSHLQIAILGGCCRVPPREIGDLKNALES